MIHIRVIRHKDGSIGSFSMTGHANYGKHGQDIVCAAVSGIAFGMINSVEELLHIVLPVNLGKSGDLSCEVPSDLPEGKRDKVQLLLEAMISSLKSVARDYGSHVKVVEKEQV
jgi:uncharacterized protein YsxB (DUF464 family)